MVSKVRKRDGRYVKFNPEKIKDAITKAIEATNADVTITKINNMTKQVTNLIEKHTPQNRVPTVEDIQDIVEKVLMQSKLHDVAKAYIIYREERSKRREKDSDLMRIYHKLATEELSEYNLLKNKKDYPTYLQTIIKYGNIALESYNKNYTLPETVLTSIETGKLYINNLADYGKTLDSFSPNLNYILENGFYYKNIKIEPPKDLETFFLVLTNIITLNTKLGLKEINIPNFDILIAKYLKDETKKLETYLYNFFNEIFISFSLDGILRGPFTFSHGLGCNKKERKVNEIILKLISNNKEFSNHQVFLLKDNINSNKNSPNYDLFIKTINLLEKKYNIMYVNLDAPFNKIEPFITDNNPIYFRSGKRIFKNYHLPFLSKTIGRAIISSNVINLVDIVKDIKDYDKYKQELERRIELAVLEQTNNLELVEKLKVLQIYPIIKGKEFIVSENHQGNIFGNIVRNGNLLIGFIGLEETIRLLFKHEQDINVLINKGYDLIEFISNKLLNLSKMYNLNINLYEETNKNIGKILFDINKAQDEAFPFDNKNSYSTGVNIIKTNNTPKQIINKCSKFQSLLNGGHKLVIKSSCDSYLDIVNYAIKKNVGAIEFMGIDEGEK